MSFDDLVLVQGMADTRRALARWNRAGPRPRPFGSASAYLLGSGVSTIAGRAAHHSVPLLVALLPTPCPSSPRSSLLLASAAVELWVSPRLLGALT